MSKRRKDEKFEEIEIIDEDEEIEEHNNNTDYENISMDERIYQIEKKTKAIFILVILTTIFSFLTLVVGISQTGNTNTSTKTNNNSNNSSNESNESMYSYDTSNFKEITASKIEKESKKETIVVMIGRQGCSYCASFAPNLEKVANDFNVKVRYIDFDLIVNVAARTILDQEAYDTIANLEGEGNFKTFGADAVKATPYTLFIKNNKIIYGIKGNASTSSIESAFEAAGFKK